MQRVTPEQYDAIARSACAMCRIVERRPLVPNPRMVFEDDRVVAFLNQFPSQEGYTLVCPKRHVERFESELSDDEWRHLQDAVRRVARAVWDSTGAIRMYSVRESAEPSGTRRLARPELSVSIMPPTPTIGGARRSGRGRWRYLGRPGGKHLV